VSAIIGMPFTRRDGRVAEGARLESVYTFTGIVGSNPTLSARLLLGQSPQSNCGELPGRDTESSLERFAEGSVGIVANGLGDLE
jgi:hypothetical protein